MGKQNKQRRAAKKRRQQRDARPPRRAAEAAGRHGAPRPRQEPSGGASPPPPRPIDDLVRAAAEASRRGTATLQWWLELLSARAAEARDEVRRQLEGSVAALWTRGWTPTDLVHVVARERGAAHAGVAAATATADGARRTALHDRWAAQLDLVAGRGAHATTDLRTTVALLGFLDRLPDLPVTLPPPDARDGDPLARAKGLDQRMLARVRALLAKAESTEFDEEAEALTAKAQELIARHAIDEALLDTPGDVGEPSLRRIHLDDPYMDAKASLLAQIALANRCRVVYTSAFGWSTAFGYESDLDALELLAASLLAQATRAMARHGSRRDAAGRSRTRSFRRSFLFGFAHRIGQRLADATGAEVAATAEQGRLLPVLAARDDRLEAAQRAVFPELTRQAVSVSNGGGWVAGQVAADQADLGRGRGAVETGAPPDTGA